MHGQKKWMINIMNLWLKYLIRQKKLVKIMVIAICTLYINYNLTFTCECMKKTSNMWTCVVKKIFIAIGNKVRT